MKIKVCGMKFRDNLNEIYDLSPDYMGFIFYDRSPRSMEHTLCPEVVRPLQNVEKTGVFVNREASFITEIAPVYGFSHIQLHGDEPASVCRLIQQEGYKVVKAFSVSPDFDFEKLEEYKPYCDYFLFDAKGANYGGNGITFDWEVLRKYDNELPIFLSGGIDASAIETIAKLDWLNIHAVDINSKFELEPGRKDPMLVLDFITQMKSHELYG
ncbi:phosphoribosylanthranilate isomerase [Cytophagaceae bacterium ABcell3]|nr:phosphoribosylanthranilate isomerase [Cytophagaceae bacterium ABcell3]